MKKTHFSKFIVLVAFFLIGSHVVLAQMPDCTKFYIMGSNNRFYTVDPNTNASTINSIVMPNNSSGLAINNNLNGGTPSPTYYTVISGIYWYYNGSTWVSTGHGSGSTAAVNPGGAGPYIYNLDGSNDRLYRYDGTGNSTLFLNFGNFNGPYDVIGDENGNVYVMHNGSGNQKLVMYGPNKQILCTYTYSGLPSSSAGGGYAIVNGKLYVNTGSGNYVGTISGTHITFSSFSFGQTATDFANCPFPPTNITLTPSGPTLDVCAGTPFTITGTTSVTGPIWTWTGPGIVSGGNTSTITLNQPGVYTATVTSNGGSCSGTATSQYTVVASGNSPPVITQPSPICVNVAPVQIAVSTTGGTWSSNCGTCLSSTGMFDPAVAGVGSHTITYSTTGTCSGTDTKTIVVNGLPTVSAGEDKTICTGTSTSLTATGASTYVWSSGGTAATTSVSPTTQTTYTVTGTDANGCVNTDDVVVSLTPNPVPTISGTVFYCSGGNAALTASPGFSTYSWSTGSTTSSTTAMAANNPITVTVTDATGCSGTSAAMNVTEVNNIVFDTIIEFCQGGSVLIHGVSRTTSGLYTASFTSANGCDSTANVTLTVNPLPVVSAGIDQVICMGESVTITASGATTYTWNNGIGTGASHTLTPTVVGGTTYTVIGEDANGCQSSDAMTVQVNPLPVVNAGIDVEICSGETVTLSATGASTYVWDHGIVNGVSFEPTTSQTYTVVGTSAFGCVGQDAVDVIINPTPSVTFTGTNLIGCAPIYPTFQATTSGTNNTYAWDFGDGQTSNDQIQTSHTYTVPACYDVKLTVTSDKGCVNTFEMLDFVCMYANPVADFEFSNPDLNSTSTTTALENNSFNGSTYIWSFDDGSPVSHLFEPTHTFPGPQEGSYEVTLIAISPDGCLDTVSKIIQIAQEIVFYVPNAFTPDGDAFNQEFKPVFTAGYDPFSYSMFIFNRWGEVIFETHDVSVGWDGTYNGEVIQDGMYTYTIRFKVAGKDDYKTYHGHVTKIK